MTEKQNKHRIALELLLIFCDTYYILEQCHIPIRDDQKEDREGWTRYHIMCKNKGSDMYLSFYRLDLLFSPVLISLFP